MKPHSICLFRRVLLALIIIVGFPAAVPAQEINPKAAKYHSALKKRPSGGYLFDRFFNSWLDSGTIDSLDEFLKSQVDLPEAQTADRLLYGYFLSKQGREDEALTVFEQSLESDPENIEALSELAKARARSLDFEKAVADVDRALALEPKKDLAVELGKLKGRWLSRSGKSEAAIKAWQDLVAANPDDEELREDLVDLLLDESLVEEALKTQKDLVEQTRDAYLKITRNLRLGDIHLRSGQREEAKTIYTDSLNLSGRDTWLEKEILAQIEQLFRKEDDISGLQKYYGELVDKEKGRIALLRRQAMVFAEQNEADKATEVFQQILKATPGDRDNRESFIALLGRLEKNDQAVEQMKALLEAHPEDIELVASLAGWEHRAEQVDAAKATVLRFLEMSDKSEYSYLRAARMLEQFKQADAAAELFDQLIAAFPDSVGAKEEFASFLYRTEKREQAIDIWKDIAATGSNDDAIRAARMLSSRGQREDAFQILKKRVDEFSNDFLYLGRLCEEAAASGHADDALPWAEKRLALVEASTDLADVLRQIASILSKTEKTEEYREGLETDVASLDLNRSCLLAELQERNGDHEGAEKTLGPWIDKGEVLALDQRVRQFISRDDWGRAAEMMKQIVELPDGRRSNQIEKLVTLYRRSLNLEEALKWIEEWKKTSPGSSTPWIQQATILYEDSKSDEAIETLRLAVNRFDDEEAPRTLLATYYQTGGKAADAERIYWNLYEESEDISGKIRWAASLAGVAEGEGKIDRLVEQFEERRRSNRTSIAPLLAISEIHRKTNNYEGRREALLEATRLRPEDLVLLKQIARIEEEEGDWERAVDTLETAIPLDKSEDTKRRIAMLHLRYGDEEEGYRKFAELRGGDSMDADSVLGLADAMISRNGWERGKDFLSQHTDRFPDDYRVPFLYAVTLEESGEEAMASERFLDLLSHTKELPKSKGVTQSPLRSNAVNAYYGELPDGYNIFQQHMQSCYYSYQYRALLRSGRRYQSSMGSRGLVQIPKDVKAMHSSVVAHLHGLSQLNDNKKEITEAVIRRGFKHADVIFESAFTTQYSYNMAQLPELIEKFPDNEGIRAYAIINQINNLRNRRGISDADALLDCCRILKEGYPHLALAGAIAATATGEEKLESQAIAAIEEYPAEKAPPSITVTGATNVLLNYGTEMSDELRSKLKTTLLRWRELQRLEVEKDKSKTNPLAGFSVGDTYGAVLRNSDDLSEFIKYLDQQSADYQVALNKSGARNRNVSSLGRYLQYVARGQPMLSQLDFPPPEMPGIAPNVLWNFVTTRNINFGYTVTPLDPDALSKVADDIKDPYLSAIIYSKAELTEQAEARVAELLAGYESKGKRLPIKDAVFASAWYQSQEDWQKAGEILESVRLAPMSRSLRQRIDAALVVCAREAEVDKEQAGAENPDGLAKWGPAAALRLRYGFLDASKRGELVDALEDFGFEDAAKRLESKGTAPVSRTSSYSSSTQMRSVAERINQLVKDSKKDAAKKLLSRTLMMEAKSYAVTGRGNWNYELFRMVRDVKSKNSSLFSEVVKSAVPAEDCGYRDNIEHAAMLQFDGNFKAAVEAYEKAMPKMTDSQKAKYLTRYVLLKGALDPEAAAKVFAEVPSREYSNLSQDASSIRTGLDYGKNDLSKDKVFQNHAVMYSTWIDEMPDEMRYGRHDFSFLDRASRYNLISQHSSTFYTPEERRKIDSSTEIDADLIDKHQQLCQAFMKLPTLARAGFLFYSSIAKENGENSDADLEASARSALEAYSKLSSGSSVQLTTSWTDLGREFMIGWYPEEYLIWQAFQRGESRDSLADIQKLISGSKNREVIKSTDAFIGMLFGDVDEFAKSAQVYLETNQTQNHSYYAAYSNHQVHSTAEKMFQIWKHRADGFGDDFDMGAFMLKQAARAKQQQRNEATIVAANYLAWVAETQGWPAAEELLLEFTNEWLGSKKQWSRFKKEAQRKVQSGSGYYYTGGDFANPVHKQFHGFLVRCSWQASIVFQVLGFAESNGLDTNEQVSERAMLRRLDSGRLQKNPDLARALIEHSPFLNEAADFRAGRFRQNSDTFFTTLLSGVANWSDKDQRSKFRDQLKERNTFGSNLSLAYLDRRINGGKGDDDLPNILAIYRSDIEAMPKEGIKDLGTIVSKVYPKGFPSEGIAEDSLAVFELLGAEKEKGLLEKVDEFLQAKSLGDLNITYGSNLERKLGEFLNALLHSGNYGKMEAVYWHGVALGEKEQKTNGFDSYDSAWNLRGDVLYDMINNTSNGGIERIAFFDRVIRKDREKGTIALTGGGMNSGNRLFRAFDEARKNTDFDQAMDAVFEDLWIKCDRQVSKQIGLTCRDFITKLKQPEMVKAVAWADKTAASDKEYAGLANEMAHGWRLNLAAANNLKGFEKHLKKIPDPGKWEPYYLNLAQDETASLTWRACYSGVMGRVQIKNVGADTVLAYTKVMAAALAANSPFNGWQYVHTMKNFNQLPRDEKWVEVANEMHEAWLIKNKNNHRDSNTGKAWKPWSNPVLLSLQMHAKLGDKEKLNLFLKEKNASSRLSGTARAIYALVEAGFHDEALKALNNEPEKADHGTGYPSGIGDYAAYYSSKAHEQIPVFLEKVEDPGLRYLAELLLAGAPDLPPKERPGKLPYKDRFGRYVDITKRFPTVDFGDNEVIRGAALRQVSFVEHCGFLLKDEMKKAFEKEDFSTFCSSQNYDTIKRKSRPVAAHVSNELRIGNLKALRKFLEGMVKLDDSRYYYRREAMKYMCGHLAKSIKNRSHHMTPKQIQTHIDGFHLLLRDPKNDILDHSELRTLIVAYIAGNIIIANEDVKSQLDQNSFGKGRESFLVKNLSGNRNNVFTQFKNAYNFDVPKPEFRVTGEERHRRVEATLAHPMIIRAFKAEKDIWGQMQKNKWVLPEEKDSEWGKKLLAAWEKSQAENK